MSRFIALDENDLNPEIVNIRQIRQRFPNTSFTADYPIAQLANFNIFPLVETPQPTFDPDNETITEGFENDNGTWRVTWTVNPIPNVDKEATVQQIANEILSDNELLKAVARTTVQLVLAQRDGQLNGLTEQQVLTQFRNRVINQLRAKRGL